MIVGHKAEMPNADKTFREHVQQKPADEFFGGDGHRALHVSMSVIPPAERDVVAVESEQSMIGDGDAMRVTAEITQYLFGTAEGWFGIFAPAGTSSAIVSLLNYVINRALSEEFLQRMLTKHGLVVDTGTPENFRSLIAKDTARWGQLLKTSGIHR